MVACLLSSLYGSMSAITAPDIVSSVRNCVSYQHLVNFMSPFMFIVMYLQDFCIFELTLVMDKKVGEIQMSIESFQRLLDASKSKSDPHHNMAAEI